MNELYGEVETSLLSKINYVIINLLNDTEHLSEEFSLYEFHVLKIYDSNVGGNLFFFLMIPYLIGKILKILASKVSFLLIYTL